MAVADTCAPTGLQVVRDCLQVDLVGANDGMTELWNLGYSATDIITTLFRVVRNLDMQEYLKLEYIKVCQKGQGCMLQAGLCRAARSVAWPVAPAYFAF